MIHPSPLRRVFLTTTTITPHPSPLLYTSTNSTSSSDLPYRETRKLQLAVDHAIKNSSKTRLDQAVLKYCYDNWEFRYFLKAELLIKGKDVIPYHQDTEIEEQSESGENEDGHMKKRRKSKNGQPIEAKDDELVCKYTTCLHCKEELDVTANDSGDCIWHPGHKQLNDEHDFWADHDDDCHGDPHSFIDDPDIADGFSWTCCDNAGDHDGCKSTRHLAKVNEIVGSGRITESRKRKRNR